MHFLQRKLRVSQHGSNLEYQNLGCITREEDKQEWNTAQKKHLFSPPGTPRRTRTPRTELSWVPAARVPVSVPPTPSTPASPASGQQDGGISSACIGRRPCRASSIHTSLCRSSSTGTIQYTHCSAFICFLLLKHMLEKTTPQ